MFILSPIQACFANSKWALAIVFFGSVLVCHTAAASFNYSSDQTNKESRYEQRQQYKKLLGYIKSNQFSRYRDNKHLLRNYPLQPYLEYQLLIRRLSKQSPAKIRGFVEQYADTPLAGQLRQNWLFSLGKRGAWQQLVQEYPNGQSTNKKTNCLHAYALYRSGRKSEAMQTAQELWVVPFSQPDECDPIFKLWRDDNNLTPELAWQRYEAAVAANEVSLARYLERFLDNDDKADGVRLLRLHTRPKRLAADAPSLLGNDRGQQIYRHGLRRLIRRDAKMALSALDRDHLKLNLSDAEKSEFYTDIAVRLIRKNQDLELLEALPIDLTSSDKLVEAHLIRHIGTQDWRKAKPYLSLLSQKAKDTARWQYWNARIFEGTGDLAGATEAKTSYENLATERGFYAFLAADRVGAPYDFEDTPGRVTHEQVHALEETPGIQRALELFTLQEATRARREWNFTTKEYSDIELRIAARVAEKWGWHEQAIRAMIKAKAWDDLSPRFPLAYRDNFVSKARSEDIPVTWSLAIARQESAFMADARSSAGALGLMQLMPATAREVARESNVRLKSNQELTIPETNIELGTAYLGKMFRRFSHNRILASAAYNAGPTRVQRWIDPDLPADIWIETIPFKETRNYVQNVLVFAAIYGRKLGQQTPMIYQHELMDFAQE